MNFKYSFIVYVILFIFTVSCDSLGGRTYTRFSSCREHEPEDDSVIGNFSQNFVFKLKTDDENFFGTVGILGGSVDDSGAAYFTAISALRAGANSVHIFCTTTSAPAIFSKSPDINVYPIVNTDWNRVYRMISQQSVVVIGPGLERNQHSINVINALIPICRKANKPIVFDLNEYFLTYQLVTLLLNYPPPGIILTPNMIEFEKLYSLIKSKNAFSDHQVDVDFPRIGSNVFIYRKGCTDMGMTAIPTSTWALSAGGSPRRSTGQGCMITGMTAILFHRAIQMTSDDDSRKFGPMLPAAIATYTAAKLVRECNNIVYTSLKRSGITSDMIDKIGNVLYQSYKTSTQ